MQTPEQKETKRKYQNSDKGRAVHKTASDSYYAKNKEAVISKATAYRKTEEGKLKARYIRIKSNFGLSKEEYLALYNSLSGCCEICGKHESTLGKRLSVDHNHTTNKVRGLLCTKCNFTLGYAQENETILKNCIEYLRKYK